MIAIVSARGVADIDVDHPLLTAALEAAALPHATVCWDDPGVDWAAFELAIIRSTWDYTARVDDYVSWAERAAALTWLHNPVEVIRWNVDKRYLEDLAGAGFPVTPTTFVTPGAAPSSRSLLLPMSEAGLVVKPAVSAGANDTERHVELDSLWAHVARLHDDQRVVMIQPYLTDIDERGETGLVFIDGRFSHAFRKGPLLRTDPELVAGLFVKEDIRSRQASPAEIELAESLVGWLAERFGRLLYTRIDLAPTANGPVVLEVEAVEPSLFFTVHPPAADRFAAAVAGRLRAARR